MSIPASDAVTVLDPVVLLDAVVLDPVEVPDVHALTPITLNATLGEAGLWTGHGAPGTIVGAQVGDEYLDVDTGTLYHLYPG